jgi:hypothetical protein
MQAWRQHGGAIFLVLVVVELPTEYPVVARGEEQMDLAFYA